MLALLLVATHSMDTYSIQTHFYGDMMASHKDSLCLDFGVNLRQLRLDKKMSQEEFARLVDVHRTYLGGLERGERNPTLSVIARLSEALNVTPSQLLKGITTGRSAQ